MYSIMSREALFDVVNAVPDPVFVKDEEHRWVLVNEPFCEMMGYQPIELLGKSDYDFLPKEQADVSWQNDDEIFSKGVGKPVDKTELHNHADGEVHIISTKKQVIIDNEGKKFLVAIIRDITEVIKAKQEAESHAKSMTNFLASMSHEIRTPMNGVLGLLEIMDDQDASSEQLPEMIKTAHKSARNLQVLLDDILDTTKIQANELIITQSSFSPERLLLEIKDIFLPTCIDKGLDCGFFIDETLPAHIQTDKARLRQIITNLASNAFKFTEQGGVKIDVHNVDNKTIQFVVSDTGPGINEDELEMLFTPFKQGEHGLANEGGIGLGLSIAHSLAKLLGGSLTARNRQKGGCSFVLELPLVASQRTSQQTLSDRKTFDLKALVVDDHPTNIKVAEGMLAKFGVETQATDSAQDIIEVCSKQVFDVIFMDIEMPGIDGFTATSMIRDEQGGLNQHTPIIAMTGHALVGYRDKCLQANMNDYITKPITFDSLQAVLDKLD